MSVEREIPLDQLPRKRPAVPGLQVGQIVYSTHGRRMRVTAVDTWVIFGWSMHKDRAARGPFATLVALDDPDCTVIWPREWYTTAGETMRLFDEIAA